jgi:2-dehydropantoate 2-reductase
VTCSPRSSQSAAVAERLGVRFPVSLERRLEAGLLAWLWATTRRPMLSDLEAGKRLELDCMTGAVAELADHLGMDVPHVRTIHACGKLLDLLNMRDHSRHP